MVGFVFCNVVTEVKISWVTGLVCVFYFNRAAFCMLFQLIVARLV